MERIKSVLYEHYVNVRGVSPMLGLERDAAIMWSFATGDVGLTKEVGFFLMKLSFMIIKSRRFYLL